MLIELHVHIRNPICIHIYTHIVKHILLNTYTHTYHQTHLYEYILYTCMNKLHMHTYVANCAHMHIRIKQQIIYSCVCSKTHKLNSHVETTNQVLYFCKISIIVYILNGRFYAFG